MKLKEYFAQLKIDLKPMTFSQKVDHIWTYNKELILIVLGLSVLIIGLLVAFLQKPDVVFSGYLVNAELTNKGASYLTSDYGNVIGVSGKQEVQLQKGIYNPALTEAGEQSSVTRVQITALCSDQSLDYIIADKTTMELMLMDGFCTDLSTFFTAEEFALLQDKMLVGAQEDGTMICYAVNISDTKFYNDCVVDEAVVGRPELYICFVSNTKNIDRCHEFWNYLNSWK